jgi:hypothetical protein
LAQTALCPQSPQVGGENFAHRIRGIKFHAEWVAARPL